MLGLVLFTAALIFLEVPAAVSNADTDTHSKQLEQSTAPEVLQEIHSLLKVLVSESDRYRKNLDDVRHELDSLKFGFTLLQNAQSELTADTERQSSQMKDLEKALTSQDKDIEELGGTCVVDHKTDTLEKLKSLYTDNSNLDSQGKEVDELGMCLDTHKTARHS